MIADRIPVGWGRGVFIGFSVVILISVIELFTLPIGHEHVGLVLALVEASVLALSVPLVLAVSSELAFVNRRRDTAGFGFARARRWRSGVAIFLPAVVVTGAITFAISSALGLTSSTAIDSEHTTDGYKLLIAVLGVWVAPWTEEVAVRGFLFTALWRRWGFWPGAFLSGFVWSALHGTAGVLLTFTCVGMLAAWLRRYTGSILPGVFVHGSWNALAVALTGAGWLVLAPMALLYASLYAVRRYLPGPEPA